MSTEPYTDRSFAHDAFLEAIQASHLEEAEVVERLHWREGLGAVTLADLERWEREPESVPLHVFVAVRDLAGCPVATVRDQLEHQVRAARIAARLDRLLDQIGHNSGRAVGAVLAASGAAFAVFRWKAVTITTAALAASIVATGVMAVQSPPSLPGLSAPTSTPTATPSQAPLIGPTAAPSQSAPGTGFAAPTPVPTPNAPAADSSAVVTPPPEAPAPAPSAAPTPLPTAVPTPLATLIPALECRPLLAGKVLNLILKAKLLAGCPS